MHSDCKNNSNRDSNFDCVNEALSTDFGNVIKLSCQMILDRLEREPRTATTTATPPPPDSLKYQQIKF